MKIELKILPHGQCYYEEHNLPRYQTSGSVAMDLVCIERTILFPGERVKIQTGLAMHIGNKDVVGLIIPRSSTGIKGLILSNTIGVIDSDYQGELIVAAWNTVNKCITLEEGERYAQLMFVPIIKVQFDIVDEFSEITTRGIGGFGSTNK